MSARVGFRAETLEVDLLPLGGQILVDDLDRNQAAGNAAERCPLGQVTSDFDVGVRSFLETAKQLDDQLLATFEAQSDRVLESPSRK